MTKSDSNALDDVAQMIWRGAMDLTAACWFLSRHFGFTFRSAEEALTPAMAHYMNIELNRMLAMAGDHNDN